MQRIVVGTAPDFVMRRGLEKIFHQLRVIAKREDSQTQSYYFHDQSLQGLLNQIDTLFQPQDLPCKSTYWETINLKSKASLENLSRTFQICFSHPAELNSNQRDIIGTVIQEYLSRLSENENLGTQ